MKRTATYRRMDGTPFQVEYDDEAPCRICGLPVAEASVGGTVICPWCDMGRNRDGTRWEVGRGKYPARKAVARDKG